jgi:hypothetical protein
VATLPHAIRTVLTDNGMASADPPENCGRHPEIEAISGGGGVFDRFCEEHGITHELAKPCHPLTNTVGPGG